MRAVAVVPAAGSAERFGGKKLLTPIDGIPLLDRTIASLLDGGRSSSWSAPAPMSSRAM